MRCMGQGRIEKGVAFGMFPLGVTHTYRHLHKCCATFRIDGGPGGIRNAGIGKMWRF